jgi:hypothetical protein
MGPGWVLLLATPREAKFNSSEFEWCARWDATGIANTWGCNQRVGVFARVGQAGGAAAGAMLDPKYVWRGFAGKSPPKGLTKKTE